MVKKRLSALFLALAMLLSLCPLTAFAAQAEEDAPVLPIAEKAAADAPALPIADEVEEDASVPPIADEAEEVPVLKIADEVHPGIGSIEDVLPLVDLFDLTSGKFNGSYYNQLDATSKAVYDAIYSSSLKDGPIDPKKNGVVRIKLDDVPEKEKQFPRTTVTLNRSGEGLFFSCPEIDSYRDSAIVAALGALLYDHPELSWLVNTQYSYGHSDTLGSTISETEYPGFDSIAIGGSKDYEKDVTVTELRFSMSETGYTCATTAPDGIVTDKKYSYANTGDRSDIEAAIENAKKEIGDLSGKSDYEKIKAIYDWVCNHMEYAHYREGPGYDPEEAAKYHNSWRGYQTAYSALVEGVTVCSGYAKSFKLLCDAYSIPCAIVTGHSHGEDHAWNYVQAGGRWYGIDCTWADQSTYISYDYLLRGKAGFTDHTEGTLFSTYAFAYPALEKEDYRDPTAPASIELTCASKTDGGATVDGVKIPAFSIPTVESAAVQNTKEITFTATAKDASGSALAGQNFAWSLSGHSDAGILLEPQGETAKLKISNSALPNCTDNEGWTITVTVSCSTTSSSQKMLIYVPTRTAKFVQIPEAGKSIAIGKSATYTARVLDQYGQEVSGQSVTWTSSNESVASVNGGVVTGVAAGTATITARAGTGETALRASVDVTVTVDGPTATTLNDSMVTLSDTTGLTYTGSAFTPRVTVKDGGATLNQGADYTVAYSNNTDAGTATVTVTGIGNYTGTVTKTFTIAKAKQAELAVSGDTAHVVYGDEVSLMASGGSGTGAVTWSVSGPAAVDRTTGKVTVTGVGNVTITAAKAGDTNYIKTSDTLTFTAGRKPLTVAGATAEGRQYDGTTAVRVTGVALDGVLDGDRNAVTATAAGTIGGANAGTYHSVTLSGLQLTGEKAGNYVLANPEGVTVDNVNVVISKADALTPVEGDLAVVNNLAHTYTYGLGSLRPAAPNGQSYGAEVVTYELGEINLGDYYSESQKASISGTDLTLPVQAVESDTVGQIGTITVTIHSQNFEDITATLSVRSVDKTLPMGTPTLSTSSITYGQTLGTITLSGKMMDGETEVPGTFVWNSPDIRPTAQESYSAAWKFTPTDNNTYAIVTGTAKVTVEKANQAELTIGGVRDNVVYGDAFALTAAGGSGTGALTWAVTSGPATVDPATGRVTVTGVGEVTVTAAKEGNTNYTAASQTLTFTAGRKTLTVIGATVKDRPYDGTTDVAVTAVALSGIVGSDDVSATAVKGIIGGANAGTYTSVTLSGLNLTGTKAGNYVLANPRGVTVGNVSIKISKAATLTPVTGDLAVVNNRAHTYTYGLGSLRPAAPEGQSYGAGVVTYGLRTINLGAYYTGGVSISGTDLILPVQAVNSTQEGEIGEIKVTISSQNYQDIIATLKVRSVNKKLPTGTPTLNTSSITYGQTLGTIALSGTMMDGGTAVPGKFTWNSPDIRPTAQESYSAAWQFTPDNNTYAIVTGTAKVKVEKADQAELTIGGVRDNVVYGDAFALTTSGGSGDGALTWTVTGPATVSRTIGRVTVTGVGDVTITATKAGNTNYNAASKTITFTAKPRQLTVASAAAASRSYDTTPYVDVTGVRLNGVLEGDNVSVDLDFDSLTATVSSASAGTYNTVTLSGLKLTGEDAENYTIAGSAVDVPASTPVVITSGDGSIEIESVSLISGTANAEVECAASKTRIYCAGYDANEKLVSVEVQEAKTGTNTYEFKMGASVQYVKVFVLAKNMAPLCPAVRSDGT